METFIGLFLFLAGFIIGLGAVTVIDLHGFFARHSPYWTEATIRSHKITKPLIWIGIILAVVGGVLFYTNTEYTWITTIHAVVAPLLIINGCFLSFYISPYLLKREQEGRAQELLPARIQRSIIASFIVSFIGWWGSFGLLVWYIVQYL